MDNSKCPYCEEERKIRRQGEYRVEGRDKPVLRFFCRSCNRSFSSHTTGYKDYDTINEKFVWRSEKSSDYRKEKREELFNRIDEYLIRQGFTKVSTVLEKVGIGKSTYNRYLKSLSSRFVNKFTAQRKKVRLKRALLLELKTKFEGKKKSPGRIRNSDVVRAFVLFDEDTGLAFEFFLTQKKDPERRKKISGSTLDRDYRFGHRTTLPRLHYYLMKLKANSPELRVRVDCSSYVRDFLLNKDEAFYSKALAKETRSYWRDLERVKIKRQLRFRWTMLGKEKAPEPGMITFRSQGKSFEETMRTLLSIHNERKIRASSSPYNLTKPLSSST